jgi:hypothetical protein
MAREAKQKKSTKLIALSTTNKAYEFKAPLEKKIKYQGEKVDIRLHEDPHGFSYIVWKNKKYMLDVIEKNQNRYTIMINGVWHSFTVETPISLKRRRYLEEQGELLIQRGHRGTYARQDHRYHGRGRHRNQRGRAHYHPGSHENAERDQQPCNRHCEIGGSQEE